MEYGQESPRRLVAPHGRGGCSERRGSGESGLSGLHPGSSVAASRAMEGPGPWESVRQGNEDQTIGLPPADNLHMAFEYADLVAQHQQLGLISRVVAEGCEGEVEEKSEASVKDEEEHERRLIVAGLAGPPLSSDGLSAPHRLQSLSVIEHSSCYLQRCERAGAGCRRAVPLPPVSRLTSWSCSSPIGGRCPCPLGSPRWCC